MLLARPILRAGLPLALGIALSSLAAPLAAQEAAPAGNGRIVGRVVDAAQGAPIAGASVEVIGTAVRAVSAIDGRYLLHNVPAGSVNLSVRMIGYQPKQVQGLTVPPGGSVEQNVALSQATVQVEEIAVTAEAERGSVAAAIEEQRNADNIVSAITSEQIQKSPDGDAGQAVQRVTGVTVQDGKYVFVRGLGERYTTTTLNGARVPSPEPERRVVPLDLFPSSLLESITASKTFTADQPGDFSGAQVNLKTKEFPTRRVITISASAGWNSSATGKDVIKAPTVGGEWFGISKSDRDLAPAIRDAGNLQGLGQPEVNQLLGDFRNAWSSNAGNGAPLGSFGISVGGEDPAFGLPLGYIASFTYSYKQEARAEESRALAQASAAGVIPLNESFGSTARSSVLWGLMGNLSTRIGSNTRLSFNNSYSRGADNEATELEGFNEEFNNPLNVGRLSYIERSVRSNQLAGEHMLGQNNHYVDWRVTSSGIVRSEPDRSDIAYFRQPNGSLLWAGIQRGSTRTFSDLGEEQWELAGNYRLYLGAGEKAWSVKFGGMYRWAKRIADSRSYDITNRTLSEAQRTNAMETVFSQANIDAGSFFLVPNANGGRYGALDRLFAGYAQLEVPFTTGIRAIAGLRIEKDTLAVNSITPDGADTTGGFDNTDFLPALSVNFQLSADHALRLSVSQTLSRPEYRELSPTSFFDPIGGLTTFGNPELERALIQNADLRWEWYPRAGETISVALFAKRFKNPIEKVIVATTGAQALSYVNAEKADNYGVEVEARKRLDFIAPGLLPFTVFANVTLMESDITPGNDDIAALTSADRRMVGQAPYVVNSGLTWTPGDGRLAATVLYNVVGKRITEAGAQPLPDTYELERHLLDASLRVPATEQLSLRFDARNILDTPVRLRQGDVIRLRYKTGRELSMGAQWQF